MKKKCETHSPIYDKQTGGSKCKKCGVLLNDFNQEYSEVKESCKDSGGDSPLNTAHPSTSDLISNLEAYATMYENLKAEYETQSSTVKELERELRTVTAEYEYAMKLLCEATGQVYSENNVTISAKQVLNNL